MPPHPTEVAGFLKELALGMLDVGLCYAEGNDAGAAQAALDRAAELELAERGVPGGLRLLARRYQDHLMLQVEPVA